MSLHPSFTPEQWEQAPQYVGPGSRELHELCDAMILDFSELERLALEQEEADAFKQDERGVARAPLKLGHLPAAFYRVVTNDFDAPAVYTPIEPEVLVVLDGVLSVKGSRRFIRPTEDYENALISGQAVKIPPQTIEMRALGVFDSATSLALAVFSGLSAHRDLLISHNKRSRDKQISPDRINLPYTNGGQ